MNSSEKLALALYCAGRHQCVQSAAASESAQRTAKKHVAGFATQAETESFNLEVVLHGPRTLERSYQ